MKFFPLKTAMACLLLAPLLYVGSIGWVEKYFRSSYQHKIENIFIGDTQKLLEGRAEIETQIAENIHTFFSADKTIRMFKLKLDVRILADNGRYVYPTYIDLDALLDRSDTTGDDAATAKRNFEILNQGLNVKVNIDLGHGSTVANILLFICFSVFAAIFLVYYRIGSVRLAREQQKEQETIESLQQEELNLKLMLDSLEKERQGLFENIKSLNAKYQEDKEKLKTNEEELFNEIVSLDEQLNSVTELKKQKDDEISELKSKLRKYERRKSSKNKRNEFDFIQKRFNVLYKNVTMNRKALAGLMDLNEDQQIKAEEQISLLNINPDKVIVKRKVFIGKKNKTTCLEVLFAYNGRLYFRKTEGTMIDVVVIGTKNTQAKDMEFLHSL